MLCPLPPLRKALLAWSTRAATSTGSGLTESVPVSMRATFSRSLISLLIWSACRSMMRKNCIISAGPKVVEPPITVAAEPLMEVSGARSSWLTMARNSARSRSRSCKAVRS